MLSVAANPFVVTNLEVVDVSTVCCGHWFAGSTECSSDSSVNPRDQNQGLCCSMCDALNASRLVLIPTLLVGSGFRCKGVEVHGQASGFRVQGLGFVRPNSMSIA